MIASTLSRTPNSVLLLFEPLRLYCSACVLAILHHRAVSSIKKSYMVLFLQDLTLL